MGGGRARLRARPPFRYTFYSQNPQKCLRGGFFEGFRGPREGFLRVFQNFRGRRKVFLGFFEGFFVGKNLEKLSSICYYYFFYFSNCFSIFLNKNHIKLVFWS